MQILQVTDNSTLKCYYQLNVNVIKKVSQIIECDTFFITNYLMVDSGCIAFKQPSLLPIQLTS